jgi:hypothetical protein
MSLNSIVHHRVSIRHRERLRAYRPRSIYDVLSVLSFFYSTVPYSAPILIRWIYYKKEMRKRLRSSHIEL